MMLLITRQLVGTVQETLEQDLGNVYLFLIIFLITAVPIFLERFFDFPLFFEKFNFVV